jgi:hypothetical protein
VNFDRRAAIEPHSSIRAVKNASPDESFCQRALFSKWHFDIATIAMKNLSAVDLNLLVAFDALLSERNVTRAARRVGLSQPALSKALHRLRDIFDDPLFERRDGVMQPTEVALKLGKPVRRALNEIQSALAPRDFDPANARAVITIASLDFYDLALMPAVLARVTREAPGLAPLCARGRAQIIHRARRPRRIDRVRVIDRERHRRRGRVCYLRDQQGRNRYADARSRARSRQGWHPR